MALPPSQRGVANLHRGRLIDMNKELEGKEYYDPVNNPAGLVDVSGASNEMMRDYLEDYCNRRSSQSVVENFLKYGSVAGPPELAEAVSNLVNDWFNPSVLIEPSQILATNGVSSLLDLVAFNLAEAGEGILVPVPMYSMFEHDLCARAGLELVPVSTNSIPDPFGRVYQDLLIAAFENSLKGAQQRQIKVKAVLISNPCNPVGRFYSRSTLTAIARFCGQNGLHLVADEIYALSEFESCVGLPRFTSVLSLAHDPKDHIFHENIHSLYGASKDWAMGGLRLGFLITRNPGIYDTCRRLALFTWVTPFSTSFFTDFIKDRENVHNYISINRSRLRERYLSTTTALNDHGIPFIPANGGLFVFINLKEYLQYFDGSDKYQAGTETREMQLCKYLINKGVYMSPGELSLAPVPGQFRFVYSTPGDEYLIAIQRIAYACSELSTKIPVTKQLSNSSTDSGCSVVKKGDEDATTVLPRVQDTKDKGKSLKRLFCF